MQLSDLTVGQSGVLAGFTEEGLPHQSRYLSLGLIPGSIIKVVRVAPLGCPWQIKVGSTLLSIRRAEANQMLLEVS
jgi:ferrous iron transport protein A